MRKLKLPNPEVFAGWIWAPLWLLLAFQWYTRYQRDGGRAYLILGSAFLVYAIVAAIQAIRLPRSWLVEWDDAMLRFSKGRPEFFEAPWEELEIVQDDQISFRVKYPGVQGFRLPIKRLPVDLLAILQKWEAEANKA